MPSLTIAPRRVRTAGALSVTLVALVAAVVSFTHMHTVAERAGEGWLAWLEPLSVDGLLVGASLVIYARRAANHLAWLAVTVGVAVSLAANLAAAQPELVPRLVAAWPAVALALSYEVLLTLVRQVPTPGDATLGHAGDRQKTADTHLPNRAHPVPGASLANQDLASPDQGCAHPVHEPVDEAGLVVDHPGLDLITRARRLVEAGHAEGVRVGRGRLARQLGIPEHKARRLLTQLDHGPALHAVGDQH